MIRQAAPSDVPAIHAMVRELAEYERALPQARASEQDLHDALFGDTPAVFAHLATDDGTGDPVGFALWFLNFSTWDGVHGIHLEDLFVRPHARGRGHGRALLAELATVCAQRGYTRLQWSVLDWNTPSIGFYTSIGAQPLDEWTNFRLTGPALHSMAQHTPSRPSATPSRPDPAS